MERDERKVVAHGEVTGHAHVLTDEEAFVNEDKTEITAPRGTEVVHEEHKTIQLPPGDYESRTVRELDHFKEEVRNVVD